MKGPCAGRGTATGRGQEHAKFGTELMMDSLYFVSRLVDPFLVQGFWKKGVDFFGRKGRCRFFNGCMELRGQGR